jgi:hypothetical protein
VARFEPNAKRELIGMTPTLEMLFLLELLLVALMIVVVVAGVIYIAIMIVGFGAKPAARLEPQMLPLAQHPRKEPTSRLKALLPTSRRDVISTRDLS